LLVRIEHAAQHQFTAGVDEFDVQRLEVSIRGLPVASAQFYVAGLEMEDGCAGDSAAKPILPEPFPA